jgi:hypothetical protein
MKENIISFKKDAFTIEQINKKYNVNLKKGFIQIDVDTFLTFIPENIFNQNKSEFDNLCLLSDKIRFSVFNDYDISIDIPEFCSQLKNKSLKNLKTFIGNSTSNTDALRIIVKEMINQPLYLVEALQQYPDTLPENEKYYFRQKWVIDKMQFAKDKFTGYKNKLETEIRKLAATDPEKLRKLLSGIFLFTEQFISDLKQHQTEFKFLYSALFKLYLNEIIYFKSYYLALIGEFHFPEINAIEIKSTTTENVTNDKKDDPKISIPVIALKYYYLTQSKSINVTKELFLAENKRSESINSFRNKYYAIGKESKEDPLKKAYLKKVIPLLEKYPRAKLMAENDLYSFNERVIKGK